MDINAVIHSNHSHHGAWRKSLRGVGSAEHAPGLLASSSSLVSEQELKQAYCSSVQALKDFLVMSNLTSYDVTGELLPMCAHACSCGQGRALSSGPSAGKNLPEKVTADIKTLVHTISKVCLQVLKPETPYVLDTISKDYTRCAALLLTCSSRQHPLAAGLEVAASVQTSVVHLNAASLQHNYNGLGIGQEPLDQRDRCSPAVQPAGLYGPQSACALGEAWGDILGQRAWHEHQILELCLTCSVASPMQVLSILRARELHIAKMQLLLQERATIARQAAELTTAACSTSPTGLLDEVSNMTVLTQHGYLYFARNALLLQRVVDMFKVCGQD